MTPYLISYNRLLKRLVEALAVILKVRFACNDMIGIFAGMTDGVGDLMSPNPNFKWFPKASLWFLLKSSPPGEGERKRSGLQL